MVDPKRADLNFPDNILARLRKGYGAAAFGHAGLPGRSRGAAKAGGARRDRTDDLLLAKQALSQLSYGPLFSGKLESETPAFAGATAWQPSHSMACRAEAPQERRLVGLGRLELPTSRLSSARSNQLSYRP